MSVDQLLPELNRLGIPYRVTHSRPGAFTRLWHQNPLLVVALAVLGLLSLGAAGLALSAKGRARVREAHTRAALRSAVPAEPATPSPPGQAPATRPLLRGVSGPYAGMEIPLGADPVAIGRDPEMSNVVIPRQPGRVRIAYHSRRLGDSSLKRWYAEHTLRGINPAYRTICG